MQTQAPSASSSSDFVFNDANDDINVSLCRELEEERLQKSKFASVFVLIHFGGNSKESVFWFISQRFWDRFHLGEYPLV